MITFFFWALFSTLVKPRERERVLLYAITAECARKPITCLIIWAPRRSCDVKYIFTPLLLSLTSGQHDHPNQPHRSSVLRQAIILLISSMRTVFYMSTVRWWESVGLPHYSDNHCQYLTTDWIVSVITYHLTFGKQSSRHQRQAVGTLFHALSFLLTKSKSSLVLETLQNLTWWDHYRVNFSSLSGAILVSTHQSCLSTFQSSHQAAASAKKDYQFFFLSSQLLIPYLRNCFLYAWHFYFFQH